MERYSSSTRIGETEDVCVVQASNCHIQVFTKSPNGMVMHISATVMYPQEKLQALAEELQATYTGRAEDIFLALQALA